MTPPTEESTPTPWWRYVSLLMELKNLNERTLARELGVAPTTPGQWKLSGSKPSPKIARAVAELFDRPVSEAFIKAEFATEAELEYSAPPLADSRQLSNAELLEILRERLVDDTALELAEPVSSLRLRYADQANESDAGDTTSSGRTARPKKTPMARERNED